MHMVETSYIKILNIFLPIVIKSTSRWILERRKRYRKRGEFFGVRGRSRTGVSERVEADSLQHLSARYCPLMPSPRSTTAAAFSPNGKTLASTHGDHTVLTGHRRTPWVVRFHPVHPEILASGSLDHEVRMWDANTAECIGSCDFYRPIAVASGYKLHVWHYSRRGETSATSPGYLHYPPPAVFLANIHSSDRLKLASELHLTSLPFSFIPSFARDDSRIDLYHANSRCTCSWPIMVFPMETSPVMPSCSNPSTGGTQINRVPNGMENGIPDPKMDAMDSTEMQPMEQNQHKSSANLDTFRGANSASRGVPGHISSLPESIEFGHLHQFLPCRGPKYWELPFLQGWLMGQSQAGISPVLSLNGASHEHSSQDLGMGSAILNPDLSISNIEVPIWPATTFFSRSHSISVSESVEQATPINIAHEGIDSPPIMSRIRSELAASSAAAAAAELSCTVKLRIWSHDLKKNPSAVLNAEKCLLTIPHAVLCKPCGRF
ncbi:hypothetical protein PVL29_018818 [Vitis rotundifolia]|uniref:Uncharacterized protein n=1 Tax=Vitis rotundifolia TaxID=103349 RepID=A0AA38Z6X1_VITRO|nr:hypothetical protein PVL29_018818 [Vitis rotundifolia]